MSGARTSTTVLLVLLIAGCNTRPRVVTSSAAEAGRGDAGTPLQVAGGGGGDSAGGAGGDGPGASGEGSSGAGGRAMAGGASGDAGAEPTDRCLAVTCEEPPAPSCPDRNALRTHAAVGSCVDGDCVYPHTDMSCAYGCEDGACKADPCLGMTCSTPPRNRCTDGDHLIVYDAAGSCAAGECEYTSRELTCTCVDDACTTDPCPDITCNTPPNASCPDPVTRRSFASAGTCSEGSCDYPSTDEDCEFGCSGGTCNPDPCAGITCTTPPASSCPTRTSRRSYASPGTCNGGSCSYVGTTTNCRSNEVCMAGACVPDPAKCLAGITNYDNAGPFNVLARTSGSVKLWVPEVPSGCKVPVVHVANGTGATCATYASAITRLATHGFLTACYEATNTGAGEVGLSALQTAFDMYPDLADNKIGSAGHSQGGQAALVTVELAEARWGNAMKYAGFAVQPANGFGDQPVGRKWDEVYVLIDSPVFMFSGTADTLVSEAWVGQGFTALNDEVEAYWYSAVGATHVPPPLAQMQQAAVPWFRWQLLGDQSACEYLKGLPDTEAWDLLMQQNPKACD